VKQLKTFLPAIIFSAAFLMPSMLRAQDTAGVKNLSLQEAIDLSIKNSNRLKASQARIDQATSILREAKDNKLPNAGVTGSYIRLNSPNISVKTKALSGGSNSGSSGNSSPSVNQAVYGIANVSLPIYSGGRIRYGIESAQYLQQA
jgi:Outer membrane protein